MGRLSIGTEEYQPAAMRNSTLRRWTALFLIKDNNMMKKADYRDRHEAYRSIFGLFFFIVIVFCYSIFSRAASFSPRLSAPAENSPYYSNAAYNPYVSAVGMLCNVPNCTTYAWGRAYEILGTTPPLPRGDAKDWYGAVSNKGSTPKLGAVACWNGETWGHVAVVEEINGNNLTLSESSFDPSIYWQPSYKNATNMGSGFQGYIYIGDFNSGAVSFDTYSIEKVEEYNIRSSVWLSNPEGKTLSEIGMQCGSDKNTALERTIASNVAWTRSYLSYDAATYYGNLASNRLYNIRYYVIVDGNRYYSDWMEASTKKALINFDTYSIENLYESDVKLSVWLDNPQEKKLSIIGIECGKTWEQAQSQRYVLNKNVNWTRSYLSYYLSRFIGFLESNTRYFARYYIECESFIYYSDWFDITTPSGGISFDTYGSVQEISDKDAKTSVWLDNPGGRTISEIGFEWGTSKTSTIFSTITNDVSWTRSYLNYPMSPYTGLLQSNTAYYCRYYVIVDEKRYFCDWFSFKTDLPDIFYDEVSVDEITNDGATISTWLNNPLARNISSIGLEVGATKTSVETKNITGDVLWTRAKLVYNIKDYFGKLKPHEVYYARFYSVINDRCYYSEWVSFTTEDIIFGIPDYILPASIETIDASAFEGNQMSIVYVPDSCKSIADYAFIDCDNLTQIRIPDECEVFSHAFDGCEDVVIFGIAGSSAESFCTSHEGFTFVEE